MERACGSGVSESAEAPAVGPASATACQSQESASQTYCELTMSGRRPEAATNLSQPPRQSSHKERMLWLQRRRLVGLWVACDDCNKYRYLPHVHDPLQLPSMWHCHMNPDKRYAKCSVAEVALSVAEEEDLIHSRYSSGSVVWAKYQGYPWWPAMVDDDPDTEAFYWLNDFSDIPTYYNVVFFDLPSKSAERGWVEPTNMKRYELKTTHVISKKYGQRLPYALKEANKALRMPIKERLAMYSFLVRYKGPIVTPPSFEDLFGEIKDTVSNSGKVNNTVHRSLKVKNAANHSGKVKKSIKKIVKLNDTVNNSVKNTAKKSTKVKDTINDTKKVKDAVDNSKRSKNTQQDSNNSTDDKITKTPVAATVVPPVKTDTVQSLNGMLSNVDNRFNITVSVYDSDENDEGAKSLRSGETSIKIFESKKLSQKPVRVKKNTQKQKTSMNVSMVMKPYRPDVKNIKTNAKKKIVPVFKKKVTPLSLKSKSLSACYVQLDSLGIKSTSFERNYESQKGSLDITDVSQTAESSLTNTDGDALMPTVEPTNNTQNVLPNMDCDSDDFDF